MPGQFMPRIDKENETAADVSSGRVDAEQAPPYICRSGYYLRSCAEILRLSRITSEIFNLAANKSLLSKLTNLVNRVFRSYICHIITPCDALFMIRGRMRLKRFYRSDLNTLM